MTDLPELYGELAQWWPLLSAPSEYAEEAEVYRRILSEAASIPVTEVLELGSGGGNNASHLKAHFAMTLVDLSPAMLEVSKRLNPECTHLEGDMRSARLGRTFDAVFVHDAVDYMASLEDLEAVAETARAHLGPGGVALFVPDFVSESFRSVTEHGGHDGDDGRSLRYLSWCWDPDPSDTTYQEHIVYVLRVGDEITVRHERHVFGLFGEAVWLATLASAGFLARREVVRLTEGEELNLIVAVVGENAAGRDPDG